MAQAVEPDASGFRSQFSDGLVRPPRTALCASPSTASVVPRQVSRAPAFLPGLPGLLTGGGRTGPVPALRMTD